ncbi:MAG: hypothetical protein H7839_08635 [Magnetococcus sp. YQC-5]
MSKEMIIIQPSVTIPDFLVREVVAKLAYVDPLVAHVVAEESGDLRLQLHRSPDSVEFQALNIKVQRVIALLVATTREPMIKVSENHMDQPVLCHLDPMIALNKEGHVIQTGAGMFALGPRVASLCRYFETRLFQLAVAHGAYGYRFPAMIPAQFFEKIQYFKNFPHSLSLVVHLQEDLEVIERFAKEVCCSNGVMNIPEGSFSAIQNLLSPTVCHNFYLFLANQTLSHTPMIATAQGQCFRYESINMHSLERLWNFTMWEIIFVGSSQEVKECLDRVSQDVSRLLQSFGLAYRCENANDPFFIREFGMQAGFQQIYDLKYEYRARLPFNETTLAIGSKNYHMDFFGRSVHITLPSRGFAHSGCIGIGLERLAFAFMAQYGIDPDQWPEIVKIGIQDQGC